MPYIGKRKRSILRDGEREKREERETEDTCMRELTCMREFTVGTDLL